MVASFAFDFWIPIPLFFFWTSDLGVSSAVCLVLMNFRTLFRSLFTLIVKLLSIIHHDFAAQGMHRLKHTVIAYSRPTTFEVSDLGVGHLCSKNNNYCCSCGLSGFRPTEAILTDLTLKALGFFLQVQHWGGCCHNDVITKNNGKWGILH